MDRRKSLKALAVGTLGGAALLNACKSTADKPTDAASRSLADGFTLDRQPEELAQYNKVVSETFFTKHEMETITILADIIIPKDEISGSASDAKVPDFIEFIAKDMPEHQTPMRGGLMWIDRHSFKKNGKNFKECSGEQQIAIVDEIAYPNKAAKEVAQGVAFFSLMRNLTCTGFYTSQIGVKDIGYAGNQPNQWNGVPDDVLKQYGVAYTEKENKECVKYS
ncbi:MAG: gluconate 2-dehydrogenase subunit 3 family protein [bacterium]|jgi:gluconate 2-dehydrogenase gamma chain